MKGNCRKGVSSEGISGHTKAIKVFCERTEQVNAAHVLSQYNLNVCTITSI